MLRLHPWRDGVTTSTNQVNSAAASSNNIQTIEVCFHETDLNKATNDESFLPLFEAICDSDFTKLESIIVRMVLTTTTEEDDDGNKENNREVTENLIQSSEIVPGLTTLLMNTQSIQYMTILGLFMICDDYDMNGFIEAIRIHPTLHSVVVKDCKFVCGDHLHRLQSMVQRDRDEKSSSTAAGGAGGTILIQNRTLKYSEMIGNTILEPRSSNSQYYMSTGYCPTFSFFSWLSYPIACCI
jgi:hypothetical protein